MSFAEMPPTAAWRHRQAREGFEVVYFARRNSGYRVFGSTAAVESGQTWIVESEIDVDESWHTRRAEIVRRSTAGVPRIALEADGLGHWWIDGERAAHLDGCLDVDLESSALTNAFPVHRLRLRPDQHADAPAAYVRALGLAVERLEQNYTRCTDENRGQCHDYTAPIFDFNCRLVYDNAGLVLEYPGIAVRAA